jgi:hypothetical protein
MSGRPRTEARRRRFCRKRHPYQDHHDLELSFFLKMIDSGSSYSHVSRSSNIKFATLWRMHHKWIEAGRPEPYFVTDNRGRTTKLSHTQELQLCSAIDDEIDHERILRCTDIQTFARTMFRFESPRQLRS